MALLVARKLSHAYRRFPGHRLTSLVGVDVEVSGGECLGLVGPNGSGKSTLLRILAGLALPRTGEVAVAGHAVGSRAARAATGYVPETLRWPAHLTVLGALRELAALTSLKGIHDRIGRVAGLTGISDLLDRRFSTLSMGQARRVVLAQALLDDPPLLLLDEPFSALDSLVIHDLTEDLKQRREAGAAIVLTSHRIEDIASLCTHLTVLREGRVVRTGTAEALLADARGRDGLVQLLGAPTESP